MTEMAHEAPAKGIVRILGLHHASVPCNDLDRAVDFYTRVLGMRKIGEVRGSDARAHFLGANVPKELDVKDSQAEADHKEYVEMHRQAHPDRTSLTDFVRLKAGDTEVVLFQRLEPAEGETLVQNGIFHQSFHISKEDMDTLAEVKQRGDSGIHFHTGPTLRWPHGRALYLWDTEGNYLELESEEDLRAQYQFER